MRKIQVFILRLLVDPEGPPALRGSLERVPEGQPRTFTSRRKLLSLLSELSRSEAEAGPGNPDPSLDPTSETS